MDTCIHKMMEAYAVVEDGHLHLGLIYPDSLDLIGSIFAATDQVVVVYDHGGVRVHTPLLGTSMPLITTACERTAWDEFQREIPGNITQATLYKLQDGKGRMEMRCTKPARSVMAKD